MRQSTGEKTQSCIMCTWRLKNEIGTQRNDQGRPFLYLSDEEIIKDKENMFGSFNS